MGEAKVEREKADIWLNPRARRRGRRDPGRGWALRAFIKTPAPLPHPSSPPAPGPGPGTVFRATHFRRFWGMCLEIVFCMSTMKAARGGSRPMTFAVWGKQRGTCTPSALGLSSTSDDCEHCKLRTQVPGGLKNKNLSV